jgi:hypothetical protein
MIVTGTTVTDSSNEKEAKSIEHIVEKENFLEQC